MKKILAISVIFALVAGAAFAQISGTVAGRVTLLEGRSEGDPNWDAGPGAPVTDDKATVDAAYGRIRLSGAGETDDGQFGGYMRLERGAWWGGGVSEFHGAGWAWWQPHEMFRLTIGREYDGMIAMEEIARFGFYQNAGDLAAVIPENWAFDSSFYGGWGELGALVTLTPIEGLEVNFAVPYGEGGLAKDTYKKFVGQFSYSMAGLGKFGLTYAGGIGKNPNFYSEWDWDEDATPPADRPAPWAAEFNGDGSKLFLYAGITAVDNLLVELGFGYTFETKGTQVFEFEDDAGDEVVRSLTGKIQEPFAIGLTAQYDVTDEFGLKLRAQGQFGGSYTFEGADKQDLPTVLTIDLLPYYAVTGNFDFFFGAGIVSTTLDEKEFDNTLGWYVNPYVVIGNQWGGAFYAGFRLYSDGSESYGKINDDWETTKKRIEWSIPIAISFSW